MPSPARYVEDTIAYGAGYDAAEMHAMSLLDGDKTYAFVTDGVDGYLFIEPWTSLPAIETVGIILEGLTSTSDFEWHDVMSVKLLTSTSSCQCSWSPRRCCDGGSSRLRQSKQSSLIGVLAFGLLEPLGMSKRQLWPTIVQDLRGSKDLKTWHLHATRFVHSSRCCPAIVPAAMACSSAKRNFSHRRRNNDPSVEEVRPSHRRSTDPSVEEVFVLVRRGWLLELFLRHLVSGGVR